MAAREAAGLAAGDMKRDGLPGVEDDAALSFSLPCSGDVNTLSYKRTMRVRTCCNGLLVSPDNNNKHKLFNVQKVLASEVKIRNNIKSFCREKTYYKKAWQRN